MGISLEQIRLLQKREKLIKERDRLLNNADGGLSGDWYRREAAKIEEQIKALR